MRSTTNYGLKKPENTDMYNVEDFNENADKIDAKLKSLDTNINQLSTGLNTAVNTAKTQAITEAKNYTDEQVGTLAVDVATKASASELATHTRNTTTHITSAERTAWNNKAEHDEIIGENLIFYPYAQTTRTEYGIEWVDLGNGTILAKAGTATGDAIFNCRVRGDDVITDPNPLILSAGTYSVSGCPSGGTSTSYRILLVGKTSEGTYGAILGEYGKGAKLTLTEDSQIQVQLVIAKGTTIPDLYFTPMIEKGSGVHSYQPYNLSRHKLRDDIDALNTVASSTANGLMSSTDKKRLDNDVANRDEIVADNLLIYPYLNTTHSDNVITFTDNGDGTIGVSEGVPTGACYFFFRSYGATEMTPLTLPAGTYTISGGTAEIFIEVYSVVNNTQGTLLARDKGNGYKFTITEDTQIMCRITIAQGTNVPETLIKPMLVTGSVAHIYTEYRKSHAKMREDIDALMEDTGWVLWKDNGEHTDNDTGSQYTVDSPLYYRIIKNQLYIRGSIKFTLPSGENGETASIKLPDGISITHDVSRVLSCAKVWRDADSGLTVTKLLSMSEIIKISTNRSDTSTTEIYSVPFNECILLD